MGSSEAAFVLIMDSYMSSDAQLSPSNDLLEWVLQGAMIAWSGLCPGLFLKRSGLNDGFVIIGTDRDRAHLLRWGVEWVDNGRLENDHEVSVVLCV